MRLYDVDYMRDDITRGRTINIATGKKKKTELLQIKDFTTNALPFYLKKNMAEKLVENVLKQSVCCNFFRLMVSNVEFYQVVDEKMVFVGFVFYT